MIIQTNTGSDEPVFRPDMVTSTVLPRVMSAPSKWIKRSPVSANTGSAGACDFYGESLLPNFDNVPTWKYATPHNIQLNTPQNESCDACHKNYDIFLTEEDIRIDEKEANQGVIIDEFPEPVGK
jgi:hypothetical protein